MGRGVSSGGGQSSLGYLFGSGESSNNAQAAQNKGQVANNGPPQKSTAALQPVDNSKQIPAGIHGNNAQAAQNQGQVANNGPPQKSTATLQPADNGKEIPAGIHGSLANNYHRADGQNCGNFITDRPSTKVHAAPGGGSSLGYLFGGGSGSGGN